MPDQKKQLEKIILKNVDNPQDCVFLHHNGERRNYTDDELANLKNRDFETRLFMSGMPCGGDSVFLRTHFTDNVEHASNFNYVRDYLKAFHVVKNWTCAKSVLTTLLTMCFELDESHYYSFATSIASGLSRQGANTDFEGDHSIQVATSLASGLTEFEGDHSTKLDKGEDFEDNVKLGDSTGENKDSEESITEKFKKLRALSVTKNQVTLLGPGESNGLIRRKFCFLMDVVFKRLAVKKFLVDDKKSNIYRVVHCQTKYSDSKKPLFVAGFAFILQLLLTLFVILELAKLGNERDCPEPGHEPQRFDVQWRMLPLAVFTSIHSFIVAIPNFYESLFSYRIYGKIGPLQMMDFIMSAIIPLVLTVGGFLVILQENVFIEAVLNSTALLFIPEIDDQLPSILGLQTDVIVKNFLVAETIVRFDEIASLEDADFSLDELKRQGICSGVQFSDYYMTNIPEQGITDTPFQPYQVTVDTNEMGHQIDPSSFVTKDCLLKKIEWKYTTGFPYSSDPRIGYLRLTKIDDEVVEIVRKEDPTGKIGISEHSNCIDGMFVITTFQMSEDVLKLRACGSYKTADFLKAFECYSLWDINTEAKQAINSLPSSDS